MIEKPLFADSHEPAVISTFNGLKRHDRVIITNLKKAKCVTTRRQTDLTYFNGVVREFIHTKRTIHLKKSPVFKMKPSDVYVHVKVLDNIFSVPLKNLRLDKPVSII